MREPPLLHFAHLADHPELIPLLQQWFEAEWSAHYGPQGPGDAAAELASFAQRDTLPLAILAFRGEALCGMAALKAEPLPSHPHLTPWAAAGMVAPAHRGQGIGAQLLSGLEDVARGLGFPRIYCCAGTSDSLLLRGGWRLVEQIDADGEQLTVFEKVLTRVDASREKDPSKSWKRAYRWNMKTCEVESDLNGFFA